MEERSFTEFATETLRRRGKKVMKITNSWGVYDAYKTIRKNGWYSIGKPIVEKDFYAVIRGINKLLAQEIINGKEVIFPAKMGRLELRKRKAGVSIVDGKLKIGYPVDWGETLRLWFEDEEARKNKTVLRDESPFSYRVYYNKKDADYSNQGFYQFALNRRIKEGLKVNIKNNKIDAIYGNRDSLY